MNARENLVQDYARDSRTKNVWANLASEYKFSFWFKLVRKALAFVRVSERGDQKVRRVVRRKLRAAAVESADSNGKGDPRGKGKSVHILRIQAVLN